MPCSPPVYGMQSSIAKNPMLYPPGAVQSFRSKGCPYALPFAMKHNIPLRRGPVIIPPIATLPVELLTRIFILGSADDINESHLRKPDECAPNFEVLVSHVCRSWRNIALHTASLWTLIQFRDISHLDRAKAYVERSRNRLLDILVDTVDETHHIRGVTLFRDEFDPVFEIITPHVKRWRTLILKVRDLKCKGGARKHLSTCGTAPYLETLQLYHTEDWGSSQNLQLATAPPPVVIFDASLPSLVNVSLIGVNLTWDTAPYLCELKSLELALHIHGVRPTYSHWDHWLRASPNLEKLSLHYSGPQFMEDDPWPTDIITLPCLQELTVASLDPDYLIPLFQRLNMPQLRTLHLDLSEIPDTPDGDYTSFIDYVCDPSRRTFKNIETLHVAALVCDTASWRKLLVSMPKVEMLEVDFRRVDKEHANELLTLVPVEVAPPEEDGSSAPDTQESSSPSESGSSPVPDRPPTPAPECLTLPLPNLKYVKCAGLDASVISQIHSFRALNGYPIQKWNVWRKDRNLAMEQLQSTIDLDFFRFRGNNVDNQIYDDDDEEEASEDGDDDDEEEDEEAEDGEAGSEDEEEEEDV
ncbi:hypothetical protein JAAARDRAFT_54575 [Jaapia argillacea MUCL 33604]|uniref:F-box domain-containing protein n=1 Tax=Jaapia argillacea MUCL 33604 TaxID=933084 RepID=A0A067Q908_9AGAM|nr:hypothetical protein JAAARDRAFT_54575 [Jaapia argillacea MUCL 33604]